MIIVKSFVERLKKIGIKVELFGNYPWIYLDRVNGKKITERFEGNHGFTAFFLQLDGSAKPTDISKIFKTIRENL